MFGIGTTEFLVIIVVAILVLGPEHLPRIMRTVSKVMSDFRRVSTEFQRTMNLEASQEEWEQQQAAERKKKRARQKAAAEAQKATARNDAPAPAGNGTSDQTAPADALATENAPVPPASTDIPTPADDVDAPDSVSAIKTSGKSDKGASA